MSILLGNISRRRQVYSFNMTRRRIQFSFLACFLVLLTVSGSALPSPLLWQCRHVGRIASASLAAKPGAMPCRMADMPMSHGAMACCPALPRVSSRKADARRGPSWEQMIGRPACDPTLISLASSATALLRSGQPQENPHPASSFPFGPLPAQILHSASLPVSLRQRPPPLGLFLSDALARPRLRAPPTA